MSIGLIIISWINLVAFIYIALSLSFDLIIYVVYLSLISFLFPSSIYFMLYSLKKISKYATIGFILGLPSQALLLWFSFAFLSFNSIIFFISSFLLCSIIVSLFFIPLIFIRRKKITPIHEIKLPYLEKFNFKLFCVSGIVLIVIYSIILIFISYDSSERMRPENADNLIYILSRIINNTYELQRLLIQLLPLFHCIGVIGTILLLISALLYIRENKENKTAKI